MDTPAPHQSSTDQNLRRFGIAAILSISLLGIWFFWKTILLGIVFFGTWILVTKIVRKAGKNQNLSMGSGLIAAVVASAIASFVLNRETISEMPVEQQEEGDETAFQSTAPKRFYQRKEGTPIFFIDPLYAKKERFAFVYETLPSGAVRFFDGTDHREYCMSQPFQIRQGKISPASAVDGPANDMTEKEKSMHEAQKSYLVSSYLGVKEMRYSTFKYAIDGNGTLIFESNGSRYALPPPYVIEERILATGTNPKIPDYPLNPDRG